MWDSSRKARSINVGRSRKNRDVTGYIMPVVSVRGVLAHQRKVSMGCRTRFRIGIWLARWES